VQAPTVDITIDLLYSNFYMRQACRKYFFCSFILILLWCAGCAQQLTPLTSGTYSDPKGRFVLTVPEGSWQLLSWEDVDCVLWDQKTRATILVYATPFKEPAKVDLANVTRHLLIAFERKEIVSQDAVTVKGREALRTVLTAWAEKTEIEAEVYVVRGEGMRYDILLWAPRAVFPGVSGLFHRFLEELTFSQPRHRPGENRAHDD
jgi:hypothetical protein